MYMYIYKYLDREREREKQRERERSYQRSVASWLTMNNPHAQKCHAQKKKLRKLKPLPLNRKPTKRQEETLLKTADFEQREFTNTKKKITLKL